MSEPLIVVIILVVTVALLIAVAPWISQALVRMKSRRLPVELALRMEEEWLGELGALSNRMSKLSFAVALMLTRRRAFEGPDKETGQFRDRQVSFLGARKSLVILSAFGFALAAFAFSFFLPVKYASQARFVIRQSEVPEGLVHDLGHVSNPDLMTYLKGTVMSRDNLWRLVQVFELDKNRKTFAQTDEVVDQLKNNIEFTDSSPEASIDFATLRYVGSDPETVQKVTRMLADLVINQDHTMHAMRTNGTVDFLTVQLDSLVARMREQNKRLMQERRVNGEASAAPLVLEHEMLQTTYRTLFTKLEDAKMAESISTSQKGGQMILVETPTAGLPVGPDRLTITGIGALTGLGFGGMAVFGLNRKQRRVLA